MRTLIVYYSRTGHTKQAALELAVQLDADVAEIRCPRYRKGSLRYLLAGYDSVQGRLPNIEIPPELNADYDLVVIGTPIWTSHPSLPIRALLTAKPDLPARVALLLVHGDHSPPQRAVEEIGALLPVPLEASLVLKSKDIKKQGPMLLVKPFAAQLTAANQA